MNFKKRKLDRRHSGYGEWKYYIMPNAPWNRVGMNKFFEMREWCWNTWGHSKEINEWMRDKLDPTSISQNNKWCWQNDTYNVRIYLRTDKELSHFLLTWS